MNSHSLCSQVQFNAIKKISTMINEKVRKVVNLAPFYKKLQASIAKKLDQNEKFVCKICQKVFNKVHQRSAHMNRHKNEAKKAKKLESIIQISKQRDIKTKRIEKQIKFKKEGKDEEDESGQKQLGDQILDGCD